MYTLQVKVASYLVGGYPLLVHASPAAFHPPSCGVEMSTSVYKGEENTITITPCDRFGNIVQLPAAPSASFPAASGLISDKGFAAQQAVTAAASCFYCCIRGGGERSHKNANKAQFITKTRLWVQPPQESVMDMGQSDGVPDEGGVGGFTGGARPGDGTLSPSRLQRGADGRFFVHYRAPITGI